jgi:hypothetical protein
MSPLQCVTPVRPQQTFDPPPTAGPVSDADPDPSPPERRSRFALGGEDGMSTAEYAIGTVAACGFAGVLWAVVHSSAVSSMLQSIIQHALTLAT